MKYNVDMFESELFNSLSNCCSKVLLETRGINPQIPSIVDELFAIIVSSDYTTAYDKTMVWSNITLNGDYFIKQIDSLSLVRGGTKSFMRYDDKRDNLTEDGKLCGLFFNISVDEDNIEKSFKENISHEMEHAYRYWCLLKNNKSTSDERYGKAIDFLKDGGAIEKFVGSCEYAMDIDEISAEGVRLYNYIKNNEEINNKNFKEYLEQMPLYSLNIKTIKSGINIMQKFINNKEVIGKYVAKLYDNKYNSTKSFNLFYQKLNKRLIFAERQLYKVLGKAFEDFNRNNTIVTREDLREEVRKYINEFNDKVFK